MTPFGIGIVGTGNIAGGYAKDTLTHPAHVRPPFRGTAWARGVAGMAGAIAEGRPHRASAEQAAHVVDVLEAAATSVRDSGRRIEVSSTFAAPPLMPWAEDAVGP